MTLVDATGPSDDAALPADTEWYRRGVFYELHVRAFADSNGDGIGDLPGLTSKLDYLEELGVTAVWLLPFYPSPLRDDGYDTADYRNIHPDYGDKRAFRRFLRKAHERNIKVITELVVNHTSDQHPWFERARRAPVGSPLRDFYVWTDDPTTYGDARIIFGDFETSNWSWDPVAGAYYWHRFYSHQPDLNYDNPEVRAAIIDVLDYWLEMGVDGLRLDAVPYLFEREGTNCENLPETHDFLRELRRHADTNFDGRMFLAEANQWPEDAASYFGDGDECHMNFHFPLMPRLFMAVQQENRLPIEDILEQTPRPPRGSQWATFLRNHDELTLEMVTDEERDYMWSTYARDPRMRINLGIRRRLAPLLENDRRKIELLNGLLFSLPGTPVIYYGDEIGQGDNIYLGDRDGVRTPMQWSPDRNGGFSKANPQRLYAPLITEPGYHYENVNVEAQNANPNSLLWWMRQLIALRKRNRVLGEGDLTFLDHDNHRVLAYLRHIEGEPSVLCVANLSRLAQHVELNLADQLGATPVEMFGHTAFPPIGELPYYLTLAPYGFFWFVLEPREAEGLDGSGHDVATVPRNWDTLTGRAADPLAAAIGAHLDHRRWYAGKSRKRTRVTVTGSAPAGSARVLRVKTEYADADADTYVMPVVAVSGERASHLAAFRPQAVIANVGDAESSTILVDAMLDEASVLALAATAASRRTKNGTNFKMMGEPVARFAELMSGDPERVVQLFTGEQSNSSATIGDDVVFKLIRRPGTAENPDLEIGRYLTEAGFEHTAPLLGAIKLTGGFGESTVAVAHRQVHNEGDAWMWLGDELGRFLEAVATDEPGGTALDHHMADMASATLLLGERTADLHLALAAATAESMAPERFTALYQRSVYQSLRGQSRETMARLKRAIPRLDDESREAASALIDAAKTLTMTFEPFRGPRLDAMRIRIHGDLHLGQVLWTGKDFVFIDFEGEPARPLSERRIKRSPLRDLAGLIRSYDYAIAAAVDAFEERGRLPETERDHIQRVGAEWRDAMTTTLTTAYFDRLGNDSALVPADVADREAMLEAYVIEKALYETSYELDNRPDWVIRPLSALLRHATDSS